MMRFLAVAVAAMALSLPASAAMRVLIIGVGQYRPPIGSLPGIDLDVRGMRDAVKLMGAQDAEIHVLMDAAATVPNIENEFRVFLSQAGPADRVVIYFSGHGAHVPDQNGDEDDGEDEFWVTSDTRVVNGKLEGYLLDDHVDILINQLKSEHVLFILDSCHSGSGIKGLGVVSKDAGLEGAITAQTRSLKPVAPRGNAVLLAAARDNETAAATAGGSALTVALTKRMREWKQANRPLVLKDIRDTIESEVLRIKNDQHPVLSGSDSLQKEDWFQTRGLEIPVTSDARNNLNAIFARRTAQLECSLQGAPQLRRGTSVSINCAIPFEGYLDIVNIGDGDPAPITLFPNRWVTDNKVGAGALVLPSAQRSFKVDVDLPPGMPSQRVELYVFLNSAPVNLYQESPRKGVDDFVEFNGASMRSLVTRAPEGFAAAKIDFTIR